MGVLLLRQMSQTWDIAAPSSRSGRKTKKDLTTSDLRHRTDSPAPRLTAARKYVDSQK